MNYFVHHEGQQLGPFTDSQLRDQLATGKVSPTDLAWREGLPSWVPAGTILPPQLPSSVPTQPLTTTAAPSRPPSLPPRHSGQPEVSIPAGAGKTDRVIWPWVVAGLVLLVIGLFIAAGVTFISKVSKSVASRIEAEIPLMEERAKHKTVWKESSYEPAGPADKPPAGVFELVRYTSPAGGLAAYVTPDPKDGKKHPAIVWAHGGFGGIGSGFWEEATKDNDQSARAFREAGIVMMIPSWRGENDNPGKFELFYGEVNDLLAAVEHVKTMPYVDPERIYIGGHSTGGTLTLLASVASGDFRAAFSFGGMPDGRKALANGPGFGNTPYDSKKQRDSLLRSPIRYARFIKRPTFYFEGEDNASFMASARTMAERAGKAGAPFQAYSIPGTHFDILHPITQLVAAKIKADTLPTCNITFTPAELHKSYDEAFPNSPQKVIDRWIKGGGDLAKQLEDLKPEDSEPRRQADIRAMLRGLEALAKSTEPVPDVTRQVAALADLCNNIMDDEVYETMEKQVIPELLKWATARLQLNAEMGEEEAEDYLQILQAMLENGDRDEILPLVIATAQKGVGAEKYAWSGVFNTMEHSPKELDKLAEALGKGLPKGSIGMALLDLTNTARLHDQWTGPHPFDNEDGAGRLKTWLEARDPDHYSDAHSAAVGLAFLSAERRQQLLPIALQHPNAEVMMEAAWADLKNNGKEGLAVLQKACLDVNHSSTAKRYLEELQHPNDIPAAAKEPEFAAKATLSAWLQHPNEVGAPPLSLEVYDHAELFWPPRLARQPVWLFKYTYRFASEDETKPVKTAYGMVGGMTWSFFADQEGTTPSPTPEDLYIKHCALEMQHHAEDDEEDEMEDEEEGQPEDKPAAAAGNEESTPGGEQEKKKKELTKEEWHEVAREALAKGNPGRFLPK